MASSLVRIPFAENLLSKVQGFDCGDEPWEREVSDWIKAPRGSGGAIDALDRGTLVWLYATDKGELVGFGSLGTAWQKWPRSKDPQVRVSVIPMLGIETRFRGEPAGPRDQRYAVQILDDLIAEATMEATERPLLILFVNEKNTRAIKFYEHAGFKELHKPLTDKVTGFVNRRMVLPLSAT